MLLSVKTRAGGGRRRKVYRAVRVLADVMFCRMNKESVPPIKKKAPDELSGGFWERKLRRPEGEIIQMPDYIDITPTFITRWCSKKKRQAHRGSGWQLRYIILLAAPQPKFHRQLEGSFQTYNNSVRFHLETPTPEESDWNRHTRRSLNFNSAC